MDAAARISLPIRGPRYSRTGCTPSSRTKGPGVPKSSCHARRTKERHGRNRSSSTTIAPRRTRRGGRLSVSIATSGRQCFGGDYAGLAADAGGVFHAFWVDNRTGYSQIWTAPLTVPGRAIKHGSPDLAELEDISPQVKLKFSNTRLD